MGSGAVNYWPKIHSSEVAMLGSKLRSLIPHVLSQRTSGVKKETHLFHPSKVYSEHLRSAHCATHYSEIIQKRRYELWGTLGDEIQTRGQLVNDARWQ